MVNGAEAGTERGHRGCLMSRKTIVQTRRDRSCGPKLGIRQATSGGSVTAGEINKSEMGSIRDTWEMM
jgi:hypothetical protein